MNLQLGIVEVVEEASCVVENPASLWGEYTEEAIRAPRLN
jgi:hypothetical protein